MTEMHQATSAESTPASAEDRRAALAAAIADEVRRGGRVESQSDYQAVIVHGKRVNHVLHLLLSILLIGIWLIVWLLLIVTGGEKRIIIEVDARANVTRRKV